MKVIVNADDYGHDENRTRAIQEAFRIGAITATTAMANRPWFERAMREAKHLGFIDDVGLHFNLTEGEPLTDEMRNCAVICGSDGTFSAKFHCRMKTRCLLPQTARQAIRTEADAQIRRFLDCGGTLMHLDSHHHVHTDFSVMTELFAVARHYGFKTIRRTRNIEDWGEDFSLAKRIYKTAWNCYAGRCIPFLTDYFCSFNGFASGYSNLENSSTVEVMVHPVFFDGSRLSLGAELCNARSPLCHEVVFWKEVAKKNVFLVRHAELEKL